MDEIDPPAAAGDREAQAIAAGLVCSCVRAACRRLPASAAALLRRVDLLGERVDDAAADLGLDRAEARALLAEARADVVAALCRALAAPRGGCSCAPPQPTRAGGGRGEKRAGGGVMIGGEARLLHECGDQGVRRRRGRRTTGD